MITTRWSLSLIIFTILIFSFMPALAGPNDPPTTEEIDCSNDAYDCTEVNVIGHSKGNHELNCTAIQPWVNSPDQPDDGYPIIVWANGWGWNNNAGETTTLGYKLGLIEWALDGPYIVVAANQWSVQESDILSCLQWADEYYGDIINNKIGLAGHSQGGGAVIKAGDGGGKDIDITATIPMNPYGPSWVRPENQDGPMLLLGGSKDTTTPPGSYEAVWEAIKENGVGGINAILEGGTHNSEAWGVDDITGETLSWEDAELVNFGLYKEVTELWWDCHLNETDESCKSLDDFNGLDWNANNWVADKTEGDDGTSAPIVTISD